MARALARELEHAHAPAEVALVNDFRVLGRPLRQVLARGFAFHLGRVGWSYDLAYRLFTGLDAARLAGETALGALGGRPLLAAIEDHRPDVVVSTYPVLTAILGRLRARGRLRRPVCAVVGPLAGLGFWVQPGVDLHLAMYEQALPEIRRRAPAVPAHAIRPLVDPAFLAPADPARARAALGLVPGPLVLVAGGGWGAGDLEGTARAVLAAGDARVLVVCGRNDPLRRHLEARFAEEERIGVLGFTRHMDDLLAAADVLVTATAGVSCFEARLRGCHVICAGFLIGHVRDNARAQAAHGLAVLAPSEAAVTAAARRALRRGPPPIPPLAALPAAGELVLALAGGAAAYEGAAPSAATASATATEAGRAA
jgi:UDP-N-acetylglucosamine:LPS N-acetylglucosamine transferase